MAPINVPEVIDFIQDQFLGMEGLQFIALLYLLYREHTKKWNILNMRPEIPVQKHLGAIQRSTQPQSHHL